MSVKHKMCKRCGRVGHVGMDMVCLPVPCFTDYQREHVHYDCLEGTFRDRRRNHRKSQKK